MSELTGMLNHALGGNAVAALSRAIGEDEDGTSKALAAALPLLMGALTKNASTGLGASSLLSALDRDHDGSVLDDVAGFLGGGGGGGANGEAILGHVLGGRRADVENGISRASGIDSSSVAKLLAVVAPIVMGALGRLQRTRHLDASALQSLLGEERRSVEREAPDAMASLTRLLDADQDGSALDDMADVGGRLLGAFFKR